MKRALNLDLNRDIVEDSLLEDFLEVASRAIDNFCQRDFGDYDDTASPRIFDLYDDYRLSKTSYARGIISKAQTEDFKPPTPDEPLIIEVSHLPIGHWYQLDNESWWTEPISPVNEPCWSVNVLGSSRRNFVRVTAQWGWGPVIPQPIVRATVMLASRLYRRQDTPLGVTTAGDLGMVIVKRDMDIFDLIKPYRLMNQKLP